MEINPYQLIPASKFSLDQLTDIYNQTRVDYMIPMPMTADRLAEYMRLYDVSLDYSLVAVQDTEMLGVAMLGVRPNRAWVTRLGVIPKTRQGGVGKALVKGLIEQAVSLGLDFSMLEVIKSNTPAHQLFLKLGFYEVGELLVLHRTHGINFPAPKSADIQHLAGEDALTLLTHDRGTQPWTNQAESLANVKNLCALRLKAGDGIQGWLLYQCQENSLSHFAFKTEHGDPAACAHALLWHLHELYPLLDAHVENIHTNDPHLLAFYRMGYMESFRRIEMWRGTPLPGYIRPGG